jgi:imidazolonepropionase-like amidohydrolase
MGDMSGFCNFARAFAALAPLLAASLHAQAAPPARPAPPRTDLAIAGVTVVDVEAGRLVPGQTVVVQGGRIVRVEPAGRALPRGLTVVDGRGQYLIPGLWDMHVHLAATPIRYFAPGKPRDYAENAEWMLPLFLAHGVTGVRDMAGNFRMLRTWRNQVAAGERAGPRIVHTGWKVGSPEPVLPGGPRGASTKEDLEQSVDMLWAAGADFVKVETLQPWELAVVVERARLRGLKVVGHVGPWMTARQASELGQNGFEHLHQGVLAGSTDELNLARHAAREFSWWGDYLVRAGWWDHHQRRLTRIQRNLATWDSLRELATIEVLVRNHTWQTPTLTGLRDIQRVQPEIPPERLAWLPPRLLRMDTTDRRTRQEDTELLARQYALQLRVTAMMARAGVPLLAGSDTPGTRRVPGMALIEELETLVSAGLTPLEALRTATLAPAEFLEARDSLGTVAPGKVADLVLLDADPLADISALRKVQAVVAGGRYYPKAELERRLVPVRELLTRLRRDAAPSAVASAGEGPGSTR